MRTPPATVPAYVGVIVNDILRDYPRSLSAAWSMAPLPSLPRLDRQPITLGRDEYREVQQ